MQTGSITGSVVGLITGHGQSRHHTLTPVRVDSKGGILKEIMLDGGNVDQKDGISELLEDFDIPGAKDINVPSMRGIKLRTMTRIPDGFKPDFNPQSGVWTASFGIRPPPVRDVQEDAVLGYWNASGFVLTAYGTSGLVLAQLYNAVHKRDVAICLGSSDGDIGCDTLRIIIVSMLTDAQREKFLTFDNELVRDRDSVNHRMGHFDGANSITVQAPAADQSTNDRLSA